MRTPLLRLLLLLTCAALALIQIASAATSAAADAGTAAAQGDIPGSLKDWRGWVLHGLDYRACPFIATQLPNDASAYLCAWPGRLAISADEHGASIAQHWRVDAPSWVPLPGDAQNWPQDFSVGGQHLPLLDRNGVPSVWLTPGTYDLRARIDWNERPQVLPVPAATALIELSVDGKPVPAPQRDANGVALGRAANTVTEADALDVHVFRLLEDGVPGELTTQIQLAVAGSAREIDLPPPLTADFAPIALSGELPARLDGENHLHVQLRPGAWTLTLKARALAPLTAVTLPPPIAPWPAQEIWSYRAAPNLRITNPSSASSIDPRQANVPDEWLELPAFAMSAGSVLKIEERSRGLAADEANRLRLTREAWLDFSGDGISAKDHLTGTLRRDWRLDVAAPYLLRRADTQLRGENEGLLITRGSSAERSGVEWSRAQVDLHAGVRLDHLGASVPVNGWQQNLDAVALTLHLPYGYRLLGAPGADEVSGSWASRWRLLDAFLLAMIALLAWRLLGIAGGVVAALYLLFGYQETGAPFWTLAAVLVFTLIRRALPSGRLQHTLQALLRIAAVLLILAALPFVADQVRAAIYPQLENSPDRFVAVSRGVLDEYNSLNLQKNRDAANDELKDQAERQPMPMVAPAPPAAAAMMARKSVSTDVETVSPKLTIEVSGSNIRRADAMQRYAENTVIQAGGGEPDWRYGSTAHLSWSGPVTPQQNVQLLILPPLMTRLLRLVLVALLGLLTLRLLQAAFGGGAPRPTSRLSSRSLTTLLGLLFALFIVPHAFAQGAPDPNILNELRTRLTERPPCAPQCAKIASASVIAEGEHVRIALEAHAGERVALPVPSSKQAPLRTLTLDGIAQETLLQQRNQFWLTVGRGVHRIELDYDASQSDKLTLDFPLPPARIELRSKGWQSDGISDGRLLTEALELVRLRAGSEPAAASGGEQQFAPYVRLTRDISLDLDWGITNTVQRLAPASGGLSVELPLLPNESVQTAQLKVREQRITIPIASNSSTEYWHSRLERSDSFTLTAPALGERAEVWKITLSPTWHAEFSGLPEVQPEHGDPQDYWSHEFHPLPGEKLTVKVSRPEAIAGESLALDAVTLDSNVAQHAAEHTLGLSLRSTRGGEHAIELPHGAQVLGVDKDGQGQNLRPREGVLSLPITPGAQHFTIRWRDSSELGIGSSTPQPNLHLAAANVHLGLNLPADRWVLFVHGPSVGPAVLYWGELLLMLALAYALTRLRRSPLRYWQWLLLGLGFSTFSWFALVVVVAWLLALQWRGERVAPVGRWSFNLAQLGLLGLSLAALLCLVTAIPYGLLGEPDMHIAGNGSQAHALQWFADVSSADELPSAGAITLPLWLYKVAMLAWALWLANAVIAWLRAGFTAYGNGGYWRSAPPRAPAAAPATGAASEATSGSQVEQ